MEMKYNFKIADEGTVDFSGLLAAVSLDLGYHDINDQVCVLSWEKVEEVEREMSRRESDIESGYPIRMIDLFNRSILCYWLATHEFEDEIVFS